MSRQLVHLPDALPLAVVEVAENSLFACADPSDEAAFQAAASSAPGDTDWVHASVGFNGFVSGRLEVSAQAAVIGRLCASFSGAPSPDAVTDDEVIDFAGELANMVCGTWLTRACQHDSFALTPPRVIRGGLEAAASAALDSTAGEPVYMSIDDAPIRLQILDDAALEETTNGR